MLFSLKKKRFFCLFLTESKLVFFSDIKFHAFHETYVLLVRINFLSQIAKCKHFQVVNNIFTRKENTSLFSEFWKKNFTGNQRSHHKHTYHR